MKNLESQNSAIFGLELSENEIESVGGGRRFTISIPTQDEIPTGTCPYAGCPPWEPPFFS